MLCPRCHSQVSDEFKSCPHCNMLLKFERKQKGLLDFFKDIIFWDIDYKQPDDVETKIEDTSIISLDGNPASKNCAEAFGVMLLAFVDRIFMFMIMCFLIFAFVKNIFYYYVFAAALIASAIYSFSIFRIGKCPYCGEELKGFPENNALTCKTCKNRVLVKNNHFYKINN